jgi:hypothetical protein
MIGVLLATVLAFAALAWLVLYVVREQAAKRIRVSEVLHDDHTPTLEYSVPTGQDPAVILAALERAGYTATADPNHGHQRVLVACPAGMDQQRSEVRSVIESASVTAMDDGVPLEVDVRFRDEE